MNYKINTYPDNTSYAEVLSFDKEFTFKINSYEDLWHLKQIVDVYQHNKIRPIITIPCLLDGQADDRFAENQSFGLKLVCDFLNTMEADFRVFHPHNSSVVKALINNVEIVDNKEFVKEVLLRINSDNLILLSPDAGSYKWISKLADNLEFTKEIISASKSRKWEDGHSKLIQVLDKQDFEGKDVLVLDDLLIGGSSLINLGNLLKTRNVGNIYAAVSHITIKKPRKDLETVFNKIYATNSKYNQIDYEIDPKILKIIDVF